MNMRSQDVTERLKTLARDLGFSSVGITSAETSATFDKYLHWLGAGMHGSMAYMARQDRVERRRNLELLVPHARSLVMVALSYPPPTVPPNVLRDPSRGRISNYAWGTDYHVDMLAQLQEVKKFISSETNGRAVSREYVDTGPILERSHAERAGLGFVGKNTMLIDPRRGSYLFLGVIVTSCELTSDPPTLHTSCGTCTRCLTQCPTHAFPTPYVLDARKCISYLTIEHKGFVPQELRAQIGNWVYGCDICQEVCPWQRFAGLDLPNLGYPIDFDKVAPSLRTLLMLQEGQFRDLFSESPIVRIGRDRLVRNACIAAGNSNNRELIDSLLRLLSDSSPLVRGHAVWALGRLGAPTQALKRGLRLEVNVEVREEYQSVIDGSLGTMYPDKRS